MDTRLRIALGVVLLAATAHALAFYSTTSDDAFISLRYAQNLIDGHGLVWNPGGERVEGFSNPTMVLLSALLLALGLPELWAIKGLGLAAFLASVALLPRLMREIGAVPTAAASGVAAAALLAAWAPAAMWSMAGLETSLYALLVLAATTQALRESRADRVRWTPWLFLLVAASRPEGLLLGAAAFVAQFVSTPSRRKLAQAWVLGLALPAALLLGARWLYYGSLVPNTYYVKVAAGGGAVQRGFSYLAVFLSSAGGLLCAAAALGLLLGTRSGVRRRWLPLMLAPLAAQIAFVLTAGGDFMPGSRFVMPVLPLLCALAALLPTELALRMPRPWGARCAIALTAGMAVACLAWGWLSLVQHPLRSWMLTDRPRLEYLFRTDLSGTFLAGHEKIAEHVRGHAAAGDELALTEAGVMPFYAGVTAIDMGGLNSRVIADLWRVDAPAAAGRGGGSARAARYALSRKPRWVVLDGHLDRSGKLVARHRIGRLMMTSPEWRLYAPVSRETVFDRSWSNTDRPRINVLFERTQRPPGD